jgi:fumarate reductase subunit D
MPWLRKIDIKTAGYINIIILAVVICIHLLVIFGVMPFTWINGGRSASFEIGQQTSIVSIVILFVMILVNIWAAGIIRINRFVTVLKILMWIFFAYSLVGLVQQLMGTTFEKFGMSILCLVNMIMYFRLAIEKRS